LIEVFPSTLRKAIWHQSLGGFEARLQLKAGVDHHARQEIERIGSTRSQPLAQLSVNTLAQIGLERLKPSSPRFAWAIGRRLQAAVDVFAHRFAIDPDPPRDRRDGQPLPMKTAAMRFRSTPVSSDPCRPHTSPSDAGRRG
jgi:hypothetical protein